MTLHRRYLLLTGCGLLLLGGFYLHSCLATHLADAEMIPVKQHLVAALGLTDLSIWTEARYTRHPTQADRFTAFQDLPASLGHFPAGSIISPQTFDSGTRMQFRRSAERARP